MHHRHDRHECHASSIRKTGFPDTHERHAYQLYADAIEQIEQLHGVTVAAGDVPGYGYIPLTFEETAGELTDEQVADEEELTFDDVTANTTAALAAGMDTFPASQALKPVATQMPMPSTWPGVAPQGTAPSLTHLEKMQANIDKAAAEVVAATLSSAEPATKKTAPAKRTFECRTEQVKRKTGFPFALQNKPLQTTKPGSNPGLGPIDLPH